jgi:hypothetical protein
MGSGEGAIFYLAWRDLRDALVVGVVFKGFEYLGLDACSSDSFILVCWM